MKKGSTGKKKKKKKQGTPAYLSESWTLELTYGVLDSHINGNWVLEVT